MGRVVGVGGVQGTRAPPIFGKSVDPISTRGADYAHLITTVPPPGFSDLPTALCKLHGVGTRKRSKVTIIITLCKIPSPLYCLIQ